LCRFARRPNQRRCCTTPPATSNGRKARFRVTNHRFRFCHCVDDNFMEPNADYLAARRAAHAACPRGACIAISEGSALPSALLLPLNRIATCRRRPSQR
jgi:hypothetical protein